MIKKKRTNVRVFSCNIVRDVENRANVNVCGNGDGPVHDCIVQYVPL